MALILALLLERMFGDPDSRWHPVAWFGRWASWWEARLYAPWRWRGVLLWWVVVLPWLLVVVLALWVAADGAWLVEAVSLWICIGWCSLFGHVDRVLAAEDVATARMQVAHIVSRDTGQMSLEDTRLAALESLAENASDAVIAPIFWFLVLGAPGAILYRMVNTLDAMWGYRNARFSRFGWWAAKVDDVANYVPARITALLLLAAGRSRAWRAMQQQATTHASPNAGWPEAALAFAANIRLGGPVLRDGKMDFRPDYGPALAVAADEMAAMRARRMVQLALIWAAMLALVVTVGIGADLGR